MNFRSYQSNLLYRLSFIYIEVLFLPKEPCTQNSSFQVPYQIEFMTDYRPYF